jgi:uncharacterized protein YukE
MKEQIEKKVQKLWDSNFKDLVEKLNEDAEKLKDQENKFSETDSNESDKSQIFSSNKISRIISKEK